MKNDILPILSASCLFWLLITPTQGTLVVSNIEAPAAGNEAIGSDSWIAQDFFFRAIGAINLYRLDSVELRMDPVSGFPGNLAVSLYSAPAGVIAAPQNFLGHLDGPEDPTTSGVYTYTASSIELAVGTRYLVVVAGSTPIAEGAYMWSATDVAAGNVNWVIPELFYSTSDGLTWEQHIQEGALKMAIHATVVPEPSTLCLAGLGLGFLWVLVCMSREPRMRGRPIGRKVRRRRDLRPLTSER
jgi:hypothetical protein